MSTQRVEGGGLIRIEQSCFAAGQSYHGLPTAYNYDFIIFLVKHGPSC